MKWIDCKEKRPDFYQEVLVWIDGKRGPSWRNNHAVVAFLSENGEWYEERHKDCGPLVGVIKWAEFDCP